MSSTSASHPAEKPDDIAGVLVLRHLLSEVITSFRQCGLERLAGGLEEALRMVQPRPCQPMRRKRAR